jgi:hypothetical protein
MTSPNSSELRSLEFPRIPSATRPEYFTKYHDIAAKVFPEFEEIGYIRYEYYSQKIDMITEYVNSHSTEFAPGDILYVGSTYESRPYEQGFMMIGYENKLLGTADCAVELPIRYKDYISTGLSYKQMFEKIAKDMKEDDDDFGCNRQLGCEFFGIYENDMDAILNSIYALYETKQMF